MPRNSEDSIWAVKFVCLSNRTMFQIDPEITQSVQKLQILNQAVLLILLKFCKILLLQHIPEPISPAEGDGSYLGR